MDWKPKTIRTLINRLVHKEAVTYHQDKGRMYAYYPLVSQDSYLQVETKSLLKRFYGAAFKPLLVNFLKEEKLSSEDINELKRILDEKLRKIRGRIDHNDRNVYKCLSASFLIG